jgi:hypothetical protein
MTYNANDMADIAVRVHKSTVALLTQDSGDQEYYTPQPIIEAARRTMGGIYLDPFSSIEANKRVGAKWYHTKEDDGLTMVWRGNVWMNHPFSREMNEKCIRKLVGHYADGEISQACCITFAATSEKWFQPLLTYPQCFLSPRTNYHLPDGTLKRGVTKGSVVTYLGPTVPAFAREFKGMGVVKVEV